MYWPLGFEELMICANFKENIWKTSESTKNLEEKKGMLVFSICIQKCCYRCSSSGVSSFVFCRLIVLKLVKQEPLQWEHWLACSSSVVFTRRTLLGCWSQWCHFWGRHDVKSDEGRIASHVTASLKTFSHLRNGPSGTAWPFERESNHRALRLEM